MSLEYQRYGRNKETVINNTYIGSGEYRNKFNHITDNDDVNRIIYSKAKEMLKHRSGTKIEDMYWIDGTTGAIVASVLNEQQEEKIMVEIGYEQDDKVIIPDYIKNMSPEELDREIAKLEREHEEKKCREKGQQNTATA